MVDIFKKMIKMGLLDWKFVLAVSVKKEDQKYLKLLKKEQRVIQSSS